MKKLMLIILVMLPVMAISQGNKICSIEAMSIVWTDTDHDLFENVFPMFGFIEEDNGFLVVHYHRKEKHRAKQMRFEISRKEIGEKTVNIFLINNKNSDSFRVAEVQYFGDEVRVILISEKTLFGYKGKNNSPGRAL